MAAVPRKRGHSHHLALTELFLSNIINEFKRSAVVCVLRLCAHGGAGTAHGVFPPNISFLRGNK